ncbi:MAG: single-stranded DNA-binding protein [Salana multivorans]|uniref:single-stranded DNA-binding protein n=1 Tax=Salana multivorans TaxID=120377 RepID=UPI000961D601|nr:single-stranded DNA-binding protein [Salana multivorans]MBN8882978.1 single-stranded DNA-binding protein [Salana multivorans]OJX94068.1 MAG: single-stranded DNA-binding protein [Micrococcales bacterium 73-15]
MANETIITIVGNLTADPEVRSTQSGAAVASFTIASTPRTYDKATGEWRDGEALFLRCSAWRDLAENVAESLRKGTAVIAQGRLGQRSYETRDGEKRTSIELEVDTIGPDLRHASAVVTKRGRGARSQGHRSASQADPWQGGGTSQAAASQPWDGEPNF